MAIEAKTGDWSILHISDTQFGRFHRFSGGTDSLASRLMEDLKVLRDSIPSIRVVAWTGDVSERALPAEFKEALGFLEIILDTLGLSQEDLLVVPGNHDVNWKDCEAHFNSREAVGRQPTPPFRSKWTKYLAFQRTATGRTAMHSVVQRPDLGLSVALLNSTVRESHLEHFGWCGEEQLHELKAELESAGLGFRLALLHHNVRRGATDDNENLLDETDLTRILGPELDLVLHGHTHDGRRDYLSDGTLVLSTGSAAISSEFRPAEVNNQYQVVSFVGGQLVRWARRYEPGEKRFVADSRIGSEDHPGFEVIPLVSSGARNAVQPPSDRQLSRKARLRLGQYHAVE